MIDSLLKILLDFVVRETPPTTVEELEKHIRYGTAFYKNCYTGDIYSVRYQGRSVEPHYEVGSYGQKLVYGKELETYRFYNLENVVPALQTILTLKGPDVEQTQATSGS